MSLLSETCGKQLDKGNHLSIRVQRIPEAAMWQNHPHVATTQSNMSAMYWSIIRAGFTSSKAERTPRETEKFTIGGEVRIAHP